jgi:glyoxylase-like metal-dependent hydrolase (beta-lactamase superfamily II)
MPHAELTESPLFVGPGASVSYPHEALTDGQRIMIGKWTLDVLHTPGHTPEHVCFLIEDWFLLTGDVIFVGDVGRIDLSPKELSREELEERALMLYRSIRRLMIYPDHTEIYPGHYRGSVCGRGIDDKTVSTLGREKLFTPALRMTEREFIEFQMTNVPPLPEDFLAIKRHNLGIMGVALA